MNYENMSSMQMDVLKELGNIGAGNAVTALSKMMGKKVTMEVPRVHVLEFTKASEILGGAEAEVTGISPNGGRYLRKHYVSFAGGFLTALFEYDHGRP